MAKIDDALARLAKATEEGIAAIREEAARLEAASHAATGGKAMPLESCKLPDRIARGNSIESFEPNYSSWHHRDWRRASAAARAELNSARESLETQHAAKLPAIENNRRVIEQVKLIMTNLGIPESRTTYGYATQRARKMTSTTVRAGYLADLAAACPTDDGYAACKQKLDDFERRLTSYEKSEAEKEAVVKREEERARKQRQQRALLDAMAEKYGCDAEVYDIIEAIGKHNKYFRLAYWLQRNRNNWNEGPDYARTGLDGFTVETEEDQAIYDDIEPRISDWDGDGRTFRDSNYGYDYLFGKVEPELMADYQQLAEAGLLPED
jgi:hypothetical protein